MTNAFYGHRHGSFVRSFFCVRVCGACVCLFVCSSSPAWTLVVSFFVATNYFLYIVGYWVRVLCSIQKPQHDDLVQFLIGMQIARERGEIIWLFMLFFNAEPEEEFRFGSMNLSQLYDIARTLSRFGIDFYEIGSDRWWHHWPTYFITFRFIFRIISPYLSLTILVWLPFCM